MSKPVVFVKEHVSWSQAKTLEEAVIALIDKKETQSEAFQSLLTFYGRPRLEEIWKAHKAKKAETENAKERESAPV